MTLYKRSTAASSGDFIPPLRWQSPVGLWSVWDDIGRTMVDVAEWTAIIDFRWPRTAWMKIQQGAAPEYVWDAVPGQPGPRPGKEFRHGVAVVLFSIETLGGVRELCTPIPGVCEAISALHDEYEKNPQAAAGLLPVVRTGRPKAYSNRRGDFFDPTMSIVDWGQRPLELPDQPPPPPSPPPANHLAKAGVRPIRGLDKDIGKDIDDGLPF
jgi:hypothetical protein